MSLFGGKGRQDDERFAYEDATERERPAPAPEAQRAARGRTGRQGVANIGKSITIKGDLTGSEDLIIEGRVEGGRIELPDNELTIGANGNVSAEVHAKSVVVIGKVAAHVTATEKVEIQSSGSVDGDVRAPRLIVQEGAVLNGAVETGKEPARAAKPPALAKTGTGQTP